MVWGHWTAAAMRSCRRGVVPLRAFGVPVALVAVLGLAAATIQPAAAAWRSSGAPAARFSGSGATTSVTVATDLPLQGSSADASQSTNDAIALYLEQMKNRAGQHPVALRRYDDSTAAAGIWDTGQCLANARAHAASTEVAVIGPYNSGCAKIEVPVLNRAPGGPLLMITHASTNPGLTKKWDVGEPGRYYPSGRRNYARVIAPDDVQGVAAAQYAKKLKVRRVFVLNDDEVYGRGVAAAFTRAARANHLTVVGSATWNPRASSYAALFRTIKARRADAVYLGGVFDANGGQLVKDKVAVLGNNTKVKLFTPDGFTGYPEFLAMPQAAGAYLTYPGVDTRTLEARGGAAARFLAAYRARYGGDPASSYALYGVAAMQVTLAAIATSDGTRAGVRNAVMSGRGITIPASSSVLGAAFSIDPRTGDVTLKETTVEVVRGGSEQFLTVVRVGPTVR